eukprot:CAMPEP_0174239170 /NCGR_PEP_ID=MMETSP0417-20130205/13687_1 /TAXON_ID=242541 /ORGANISM="Mayorella sp, Strain BSH-02190019" /LENGTH=481 /DNA_ID=CAMNT_0015318083 /DNA_START=79 /DNA_END=1521 /DNA_ORIENTATION=+
MQFTPRTPGYPRLGSVQSDVDESYSTPNSDDLRVSSGEILVEDLRSGRQTPFMMDEPDMEDGDLLWSDNHEHDSEPLLGASFRIADTLSRPRLVCGFLLFVVLGMAPQFLQNAIFSETPMFMQMLPEGRAITANLLTAFFLANIITLAYLIIDSIWPLRDDIVLPTVLTIGVVNTILLSFFWDTSTEFISSTETSWPLLICAFIAGGVGNTSTLVLFNFASLYMPVFSTAVSVGYALSGFGASIIVWAQNPSSSNFPPDVFFLVATFVVVFCLLLYALLHIHPLGTQIESPDKELIEMARHQAPQTTSFLPLWDGELVRSVAPLLANLIYGAILTFSVPAMLPFMIPDGHESWLGYLNSIYLIFPSIGILVASLTYWKWPYGAIVPWLVSLLETLLAGYMFLAVMDATHEVFPSTPWIHGILLGIFVLCSGYRSTFVFMRIRDVHPGDSGVQVGKWAACATQFGALLGIGLSDLMIGLQLF